MKDIRSLATPLFYAFSAVIAMIVVLFAGVYLYTVNPSLFSFGKDEPVTATEEEGEIKAEWAPKDVQAALASGEMDETVEYGYRLLAESAKYMGPNAEDPEMHFAGNTLSCTNCHLDFGTRPGSASWVGVVDRFPQFRGRENREGTIEDRINGCMERSMNGKALPTDSKEMEAIVTYMSWLGEDLPEEKKKHYKGFVSLEIPEEAVDLERGKAVYTKDCMICHGENGQGVAAADPDKGWLYPPLWGDDTYNDGAGMHRVITAAQFIKGNMPFGVATWENPQLTDEEAFHVAGYINSFSRPEKANKEADFPDLKLKPMSTPYGPYADNFSPEQHKYGPYGPIAEFYLKEYGIKKDK
ncbi:c-type cytochrome [Salinimicrobium flavum]|uniref:C-type cytochrome n=1 Tax=Salinimicrobium flavum TaxID=1737065 RepID=A0ABW5IVV6_9FLAO